MKQSSALLWRVVVVLLGGLVCAVDAQPVQSSRTPKTNDWSFCSDTMMPDETALFAEDVDPRTARLLFKPKSVVSVKAANGSMTYEKGRDYEVDLATGVITLTPDSRIKTIKLYGTGGKYQRFKTTGNRGILFSEGRFFHDLQVSIAYVHSGKEWIDKPYIPAYRGGDLSTTTTKLTAKSPVTMVLFGDSISTGCNAVALKQSGSFRPAFGPLVAERMKKHYGGEINFHNHSKGGKTSTWGVKNVGKVSALKPDLVMLAFGMNEGGAGRRYMNNNHAMIKAIRKASPACEFILIANMLPNPEWANRNGRWAGHRLNRKMLLDLEPKLQGVVVADVMTITAHILKRKKFADICGNNINHPNNFIHRLYADVISRLLIP